MRRSALWLHVILNSERPEKRAVKVITLLKIYFTGANLLLCKWQPHSRRPDFVESPLTMITELLNACRWEFVSVFNAVFFPPLIKDNYSLKFSSCFNYRFPPRWIRLLTKYPQVRHIYIQTRYMGFVTSGRDERKKTYHDTRSCLQLKSWYEVWWQKKTCESLCFYLMSTKINNLTLFWRHIHFEK